MRIRLIVALLSATALTGPAAAQGRDDPFKPIDDLLRAPSESRSITGRPGPGYWQQQADFDITVELDIENRAYSGAAELTYTNNSPDTLDEIWFGLEQNRFAHEAVSRFLERFDRISRRSGVDPELGVDKRFLRRWQEQADRELGFTSVEISLDGEALDTYRDGTLLRVDLPESLAPGDSIDLDIAFAANLVDADAFDARSGYEILSDGTPIFGLAHWFPRPAAYTDYRGWHVEQFIGQGEMTTEFGDYTVAITVPDTYIVASTGTLTNERDVLSPAERRRLRRARSATDGPVMIVTREEADARREAEPDGTKTWVFDAADVRDFAFAASPAFMWDGMAVDVPTGAPSVLAQSYYPHEGSPVWDRFSTEATAHAIEVYAEATFVYPYPQMTTVNGVINSGMEYPMISFNGPRPHPEDSAEGVYTARDKYRVIGIVVHETGHMFFPMIVNSDERLYMWMDEGLNTFLETRANLRWEPTFDEGARKRSLINYMTLPDDQPIMTSADSLIGRGFNAYVKPTAALFVLRELVLGREAFDRAFAEYATAWAFKRPTPADFFRIMEQESGEDLDWFWRAWFYGTDHVDIAVNGIVAYDFAPTPDEAALANRERFEAEKGWRVFEDRNRDAGIAYRTDERPYLADVYTENDVFTPTEAEIDGTETFLSELEQADRRAYRRARREGLTLNVVTLANIGGVPSPVPIVLTFEDGTTEDRILPVHIWRTAPTGGEVQQLFVANSALVSVEIDPDNLMLDADLTNNAFPQRPQRRSVGYSAGLMERPESLMRDEKARADKDKSAGSSDGASD